MKRIALIAVALVGTVILRATPLQAETAFFLTVMDVRSVGLETAQGTVLTEGKGSTGISTSGRALSPRGSRALVRAGDEDRPYGPGDPLQPRQRP
jgi:hypothetical protein